MHHFEQGYSTKSLQLHIGPYQMILYQWKILKEFWKTEDFYKMDIKPPIQIYRTQETFVQSLLSWDKSLVQEHTIWNLPQLLKMIQNELQIICVFDGAANETT